MEEAPSALLAAAVRVPCSTSNLGAGFDCLGLAFNRYLDVGYIPGTAPLRVARAGTLASFDIPPEDDVIIRGFLADLRRRGVDAPGGRVLATSSIPVGRGLGSSGAAAVAGLALAAAVCGETLDRDAALASAVKLEGHPDNAAPALFGGLVAIVYSEHIPRAMRLPLSSRIAWVFAAPDVEVSTQRARAALPQQVPHSAASRNLGRMAALLYGLANADRDALLAGFTDELHVPYRLPLIPGATAALRAAQQAGAWAATISGSGSGMIAACERGDEGAVLDAMLEALRGAGAQATGFIALPDAHGAQPRDIGTLADTLRERAPHAPDADGGET